MFVILMCLSFLLINGINTRVEEGYSQGLLSVCPGSNKYAEIPRSQLKYLGFVVQGKNRSRKKYTYWNAKNIATDPRMDFKKKTLVIAHGYLDNPKFLLTTMFANEYQARNYSIIIIDNQRFSRVHFFLATRMMRPVGRHVAEVLVQLTESGLDPSKLELFGYGLGGQTVSFIASHFQKLSGRNVSRITTLDPSGPCFRTLGPEDRLDASDADFVQVVHGNVDGFGMAHRMGHVDFYVNGGEYQPADLTFYTCMAVCSHYIMFPLWQAVLKNPDKYIAIKCDSIQQARDALCYDRKPLETNIMGLNVDTTKHGIFYLSTSRDYPYYLGKDGLKPEFASWKRITNVNDGDKLEIYT